MAATVEGDALDDEPTTEELELRQLRREQQERDRAGREKDEDSAEQHERRADKAAYLREKLEQRRAAEEADG